MQKLFHFVFLFSRHKFDSSPQPNRSRYQKSVRNLASSKSWLHAHRVWRGHSEFSRSSTSHSTASVFQTTHNSRLPVGLAWNWTEGKLFGPMRSICVPSFILIRASVFDIWTKFSDPVQEGAVEPPCHARFWNFSHVYWLISVMCLSSFIQFQAC